MCEHCNIEEYSGEVLLHEIEVDGTDQNYEIYILDDLDGGYYTLCVDGTFSDIRIKINYCPACGRELGKY